MWSWSAKYEACVLIEGCGHSFILSFISAATRIYSRLSTSNSFVVSKYAPLRKLSINSLVCFSCDKLVIENQRKGKVQEADTRWNQKRHIPPVSLLLWHEMAAVRCFVWPPALQLWSMLCGFLTFFQCNIQSFVCVFLF